jgi:hypothetical protein
VRVGVTLISVPRDVKSGIWGNWAIQWEVVGIELMLRSFVALREREYSVCRCSVSHEMSYVR